MLGNFKNNCRLLNFQNKRFQHFLSRMGSECQTVWIQIRPDAMLGLILILTFFKGYQQTALTGKELTA